MKENYTHITVILDRTGSMEPIRDDTIGGFNTFLAQQKETVGTASLTLVQFDSVEPYEVLHDFLPIEQVIPLSRDTYVPRANTPLWDAFGSGIGDLEGHLAKLDEADKPAKVLFVVVTDGQENASREFNKQQIQKMIADKKSKDGWEFVFLSTDLDAMDDAHSAGVGHASSMLFRKNKMGSDKAWSSLSERTRELREMKAKKFGFTKEDREEADKSGKDNSP